MKSFNKVIIVYKEGLGNVVRKIKEELEKDEKNISIVCICHNKLTKPLLNQADLVITIGGDGTFIEAANLVEDCFILGINSNPKSSEGALTSLNIEEIGFLKEIFNGNFDIIKRQRATVKKNGLVLDEYSLNEVYIGANLQFHSSRYIIKYGGNKEEQRSSGVIISTGTGSGAWHRSAGGEKFGYDKEKLSFVVREPYVGKRIYIPTILKGEILRREKIIFESTRDSGGIIAVGFKVYDFNKGDCVEIELSDKPLKVIVKNIPSK